MAFYCKCGIVGFYNGYDAIRKFREREERDAFVEKEIKGTLDIWRRDPEFASLSYKEMFEKAKEQGFARDDASWENSDRKRLLAVGDAVPWSKKGAKVTFAACLSGMSVLCWDDDEHLIQFKCGYWRKGDYIYLSQGKNWEYPWDKIYEQDAPTLYIEWIEMYIREHFRLFGRWCCKVEEFKALDPTVYSFYMYFKAVPPDEGCE